LTATLQGSGTAGILKSARPLHSKIILSADYPRSLARGSVLLFKYVSPDAAAKVLERADELSIRFGLPSTYNDPYELFLEPDPPLQDEEQRAFYNYFLGKIVEAPVACFSKKPDSVVMWAHYSREGTGISLGFDEDELVEQFPLAYVGDIAYSDGPAKISSGIIDYAFTTGKRRHTFGLLRIGHRAAYFIKRTDWEYEAERRVVVVPDAVENRNGILLGKVNPKVLRYIILGPKVGLDVRKLCQERAKDWSIPLLRLRIGSRTFKPFFTAHDMPAATWSGVDFEKVAQVCAECGEPADLLESGKCQWCDISEEAKESAPRRSLLTLSLSQGIDKGIPFEFDGMEPRGHLATESNRPLKYRSGEEIQASDHVLFHGNPTGVEFVCLPNDPNAAATWYARRYGSGVLISDPASGRTFISKEQLEYEDLVFVSRASSV
jgi:hypothetical protein